MAIRFAFLVLEEHPYGRDMLKALFDEGFVPEVVIQEVSAIGDEERQKFFDRMAGCEIAPRINELVTGKKIPIYNVPNHNGNGCYELLQQFQPELIVLGGTRIIKERVLTIPPKGTLNAHPGMLPWLRGSASVGWALYKNLPVGATVHYIDPGIDTGDIIYREQIKVVRGDTYESLNGKVSKLSAELMVRAVRDISNDLVNRIPQDPNEGETFRVIPEDLLAIGKQALADGSYGHFNE
ncbi:MAG: hypothetical protein GXY37_08410 [Chloroflexi bacterium]|nr:hypothetical protein [Chloroflexota bacterium]